MGIDSIIETAASQATDRLDLWSRIANGQKSQSIAEVGVYKGDFAAHILKHCPAVQQYYLIDPWRHLDDWNKPWNRANHEFSQIKEEALRKTEFAAGKRVVLQGTTTEVSNQVPDRSVDLAYIDGDHTLRGITIDLLQFAGKIRPAGLLAGDDFGVSAWQHGTTFEPTLVFPFAVYFAEATGSVIYGLPFNQFAIVVNDAPTSAFEFRDLTGVRRPTTLLETLKSPQRGLVRRALGKVRRLLAAGRS